jgi:hypothetical protein
MCVCAGQTAQITAIADAGTGNKETHSWRLVVILLCNNRNYG